MENGRIESREKEGFLMQYRIVQSLASDIKGRRE